MKWFVARCAWDDDIRVSALVEDLWEPFAVENGFIYWRKRFEGTPVGE